MSKIRRYLLLMCAFALSITGCLSVYAYTDYHGIYKIFYNSTSQTYRIDGLSSSASGDITLPSEHDGKPITSISSYAFDGETGITGVTIPSSIRSIGFRAFLQCSNIKYITLSEGLREIDGYAFSGCSGLTTVTLPASVYAMGEYGETYGHSPFFSCDNLTAIEVKEDNQYYSDIDGVLFNKEKTILYQYPQGKAGTAYTVPAGVTEIEGNAFSYSDLTDITLPDGLKYIWAEAFRGIALTEIVIPDSVQLISKNAFADTDLTEITIPRSVQQIDAEAFYSCPQLSKVYFLGKAPSSIQRDIFKDTATLTIYYPYMEEESYTTLKSLYSNVNWVAVCGNHHTFTNYISDGNATCETDGTETAKCDRCDATDTRPVIGSATGHDWGAWEITKQPTQTENGMAERVCRNDDSHTEQQDLPVLTDTVTWTKGESQSPTCEANGYQKYTSEYGEVTELLQKLGHSFTKYVSDGNATCETDGTETAKCDRCDTTDTRPVTGSATSHDWGAWTITKQPTQTETGMAERICQNDSSHKDTKELPVLTDISVWTKGEYRAPTCTVNGKQTYTSEYGTIIETLQKLGHSFTNYITDIAATCTTDGIKTAKCDRCDETDTKPIPAFGHDWKWEVIVHPTQTSAGMIERICKRDGEHQQLERLAELSDTSFWALGAYTAPSCTIDGAQIYKCAFIEYTVTFPAIGHSFTNYVTDVAATCTTDGIKIAKCDRCDETDTKPIPAFGHDWKWSVTVAPTLTTPGMSERKCANDSTHRETKKLPPLTDNNFWTFGDYTPPTGATDGAQEYVSDYGTVTVIIPATGRTGITLTLSEQSYNAQAGIYQLTAALDNQNEKAATGTLLVAAYDGTRLIGLQKYAVENLGAGETQTIPAELTTNQKAEQLKVFFWDMTTLQPLGNAAIIEG